MPGFDWKAKKPAPTVTTPTLYPTRFRIEYRAVKPDGSPGDVVATAPAPAGTWIYTDIPGDGVFKLDNRAPTGAGGVGLKLFSETDYNFYFSYPDEKLEAEQLEGSIGEADCHRATTGKPQSNRLEVTLPGKVVRARLGEKQQTKLERGAAARVWVPSKRGGKLVVKHSEAEAKLALFHPDLATAFKAKARDEKGNLAGDAQDVAGKGEVSCWLAAGEFQWFFIQASRPGELTVTFLEEAVPRDKDGSPMFPYHFYYWPVNKKEPWEGKDCVLRRYARAFGQSEDECVWWEVGGQQAVSDGKQHGHDEVVKRANAKKYEQADQGHYRPSQPGWAGHCHNSAPASILFKEPPKAGKTHGGVKFDQGELEFFQTEFFGNYGQLAGGGWNLPELPVAVQLKWTHGSQSGSKTKQVNLLRIAKPGEADPATALEAALYDQLHWEGDHQGERYVQFDQANAKSEAARIVQAHGGAAGFKQALEAQWRRVGASWLAKLFEALGDKGEPVMGDVRSNQAAAGPGAIWNNVAMYCRARLSEHEGSDDEKDLDVEAEVFFNIDNVSVIGHPTCELKQGEVQPHSYWARTMQMRLRYSDQGAPEPNDPRNAFTSFKAFGNGWSEGEVYFVTYLAGVRAPPSQSRLRRDDFGGGNPYIDWAPLQQGVIELRDRYK